MANPEPSENISGDTAADPEGWSVASDPATRAEAVIDRLGELYWRKRYGDKPAFACLVRTILSQNTSDVASKPAYDALVERFGDGGDFAATLAHADRDTIAATITPAGLYNQKATVIQSAAETILEEWGSTDAFDAYVRESDPEETRELLLSLDGVGPKTADCVLLFAGGCDGVFPADTHVYRIARRIGLAPATADHEGVRRALETDVPPDKCGFGHTSMIQFGREYCTARMPVCLTDNAACPLADVCDQRGVDPERGRVIDPREEVSGG